MKIIGNIKKLFITLTFVLLSIVSYSQSFVVFLEQTYDFGKIKHTTDTLVANFYFKNKGCDTLIISSAKPSCGCTVASFPQTTAPNSGGAIVVKYYNNTPGFINKSVSVTTNDPNNPVIVLRIKGQTY